MYLIHMLNKINQSLDMSKLKRVDNNKQKLDRDIRWWIKDKKKPYFSAWLANLCFIMYLYVFCKLKIKIESKYNTLLV